MLGALQPGPLLNHPIIFWLAKTKVNIKPLLYLTVHAISKQIYYQFPFFIVVLNHYLQNFAADKMKRTLPISFFIVALNHYLQNFAADKMKHTLPVIVIYD